MLIFLDSSILCSDFYMKNAYFCGIKKIGTIVLGQIVVDETVNKYREMLSDNIQHMSKALRAINNMVENQISIPLDDFIETETEKYRNFLDFFSFENFGGAAESYPDDPHEVVVRRALQRKKPFKADGSTGYRDYLVWRTALNLAYVNKSEDVHFITSNVNDFSSPTDKNKLHDDLLMDLKQLGISCSRFHYWSSMRSFLDNYAAERILEVEQREQLVDEIEKNKSGYYDKITEYIENSIVGTDISKSDVLVPGKRPIIKEIMGLTVNQIDGIAEITKSNYLLNLIVDSICKVESYSDPTEVSELSDCEEFDIEVLEHNGDEWLIQTTIGLYIHLCAIYNKESNMIESVQTDYIDDLSCPYGCWE